MLAAPGIATPHALVRRPGAAENYNLIRGLRSGPAFFTEEESMQTATDDRVEVLSTLPVAPGERRIALATVLVSVVLGAGDDNAYASHGEVRYSGPVVSAMLGD